MEQKPYNVYDEDVQDAPEMAEYVQPADMEHLSKTDLLDKLRRCGYVLLKKQEDHRLAEEAAKPVLEQLKQRIENIKEKMEKSDEDIERFKIFIKLIMDLAETDNVKAPEFTLYKKTTPKVEIDIRMTPEKAPKWAIKKKLDFDKIAIKKHIQETGEICKGITLVNTESVIIKK